MTPVVELQQVSSGVLRALDVLAYPGERVGIIAEAGSGKSALAELLVGVRLPRRGRVRRDGRDVTRRARVLEPAAAAPGVGWVAQPPRPFPRLSVYENVLVAASVRGRSSRLAEGHTRRALDRLGLADHADRLPADLDPPLAVRLDVARVVAAPRRLIVVDQLADRVDDAVRRLLIDVLEESVAAGAALVWLERPEHAPRAVDRLLVLAYGRIAQEGPPEQVLATAHFGRAASAARPAPGASAAPESAPPAPKGAPAAPEDPVGDHPAGRAAGQPPGRVAEQRSRASAAGNGVPPTAGAAGSPPGEGGTDAGRGGTATATEQEGSSRAGRVVPPAPGGRRRQRGRRGRGRTRGQVGGQPALAVAGWTVRRRGAATGTDAIPADAIPADAIPAGAATRAAPTSVELRVVLGEVVAVTSRNAPTTSELLASLAGLVEAEGTLVVAGRDLTGASAAARARAGLAFVPHDGGVADGLTVDEHLSLAGARRWRRRWTRNAIFGLFPSLAAARQRPAGGLPSLERRCLALARALVTDPHVVLVDEPVRGVASRSAPVVLQALAVVARTAAVVLAERPDGPALTVADRIAPLDPDLRAAPAEPAGAAR